MIKHPNMGIFAAAIFGLIGFVVTSFKIPDSNNFELTRKKWTQNFSTLELDNPACNMTFSEKMSNLISKERDNIQKIKSKQKQNIQFMIEQQMRAELINYKNLEKDKKVKENREKRRKENKKD